MCASHSLAAATSALCRKPAALADSKAAVLQCIARAAPTFLQMAGISTQLQRAAQAETVMDVDEAPASALQKVAALIGAADKQQLAVLQQLVEARASLQRSMPAMRQLQVAASGTAARCGGGGDGG